MTRYKAVKLREADHAAVVEAAAELRLAGVAGLPAVAREALADGVHAGSVVAAAVALLRQHLADLPTRARRR